MSVKLIAIDIDGTLINSNHEISKYTKEVLQKAKNKGIKIVLCTGRPLLGAKKYLEELNLTEEGDYAVTYNGALVQHTSDEHIIVNHTLTYDEFMEVEYISRQIGVHMHTIDMEAIYTANKDIGKYTIHEAFLVGMPVIYKAVDEMSPNIVVSKMMYIDDAEILDPAIEKIPAWFFDKYACVKSTPFYLEILNKNASKGNALAELTEKLGIKASEVMAIGDNQNDLSMLEFAGESVAMENGTQDVKDIAKHITKTNDEDGVAHIIDQVCL